MFRISEEEINKFKEYEKMMSLHQQGLIEDEALPGNLAFMGLNKHQVAYSLAENMLQEKIDLKKTNHQTMLGLALQVQKKPETWSKLTPAEQMTLLHLHAAQLDDEHRQYHLKEISSELLTLGAPFITSPMGGFIITATQLILKKFGNTSSTEIGPDVLQHLHRNLFEGENLQKLLDKRFKLSKEGLQYVLSQIYGKPQNQSHVRKLTQEIAERKEEKASPSQKRDINLTEILSPIFNDEMKPLVNELVHAWTNESIEGFESESSIMRLHNELMTLKQNKASAKAILEKGTELKNHKVEITRQRIQFDKKMENAGQVVNGASSIALLMGNPRLAREISVVANSTLKVGQLVAGLCGFGTLAAGINPVVAASTLLDCTTQIAGLFSGTKDPSELILSGIFGLGQQIEYMRQEMHIRFDEVMRGLNHIDQQQLRHFGEMKRDNESIIYSLKLIRRDQEQYRLETGDQLKQVIQGLDDLSKTLKTQRKRDALRTIISDVRKQLEEKKLNPHGYESARATVVNFAETLGSGATHEDLTGIAIKPDNFHLLDATLDESSPDFNLNTLAQYFFKHHADGLINYTPELVKNLLSKILSADKDFSLAETMSAKHLFKSQPKSIKINSLLLTLNEFKSSSALVLIVPIQVNARWGLLLVHKKTGTAALFSCSIHANILNRINDILITSGISKEKISTHPLPSEVSPNLSAIWLVEAAKLIVKKCKNEVQVKELTAIKVSASKFKEQLAEHKLMPDSVNLTISNPRILRFLYFQLLQLTYTQYPQLGNESFPIAPCEIEGMQSALDQSEMIYQFFTKCFDKTFFDKLFSDYNSARNEVIGLINKRAKEFETTLSDDLNTKAKELARTAYFADRDTQCFMQEEIPINAYGSWFNRKGGGKCYQQNLFDSKHNQWHFNQPYNSFGSDTSYFNQQKKQITTFKETFMKPRQLEFDSYQLNNNYAISSYQSGDCDKLKDIGLPTLIAPHDLKAELPLLPAPKDLFNYLSAATQKYIKQAQALCIGHLNYTYEIVEGSFCININFEVYRGQHKGNVLITQLSTKYNPLFYTGKEAAWWFWCGGEIPVREDSTMCHVGTGTTSHNNFLQYAYVPTKVTQRGIIYADSKKEEHSSELKQSQAENTTELAQLIGHEYRQLRRKFYKKIADECELNVSELGQAVTRLNAQYKLLYLFTQLLFPFAWNDANSPISNYFNKYSGIKNKLDLLTALQGCGFFCIGYFEFNSDLDKMHSEINQLIDMITQSARLKSLDEIQMHLLNALDDLVPNLCAGPSITDRAKFYEAMSKLEENALVMLSTMSPAEFEKTQSKLKQALSIKAEVESKFVQGDTLDANGLMQPLQNLLTGPSLPKDQDSTSSPEISSDEKGNAMKKSTAEHKVQAPRSPHVLNSLHANKFKSGPINQTIAPHGTATEKKWC